ncbi:MAG: carboxymuconolactone decarboxylase family protein [Anaerolineales bacterium]|nr:carboxymuconolactone decarboxylase family protein [Anaerolineales bacterium]
MSKVQKQDMDARRYELVTLAAARALKGSYCMLAHGTVVLQAFYTVEQLTNIARDYQTADLTPAEVAMMAFAEQVARDATAVSQDHIDTLRQHGFSDAEIFDITTTAAARCFMVKTADALGAEPDEAFMALDENLRQVLVVGRPIEGQG